MPSAEEYGAFLDQRDKARASSTLMQPRESTPDEAATTLNNSIVRGVPFAIGNTDPKHFNEQSQIARDHTVTSDSQAVQTYLNNNDFAAHVSGDDLEGLSMVGKFMTSLKSGFAEGQMREELGTIGVGYQLGGTREISPRARQIMEQISKQPRIEGAGYSMAHDVGQMVGHFIAAGGGPAGYGGAAIGAAAGAATGPGAVVASPVGALGGFFTGTFSKMAIDDAVNTYLTLDAERSPTGARISEPAKQAASIAVGLVSFAGMKVGASPVVKEFTKEVAIEAMKKPAIASMIGRGAYSLAQAGAIGGAANMGMTFADTLAEDMARWSSDPSFLTIINDPQKRVQFKDDLIRSFAMGAAVTGTLHGTVQGTLAGFSALGDRMLQRQSRIDSANLKQTRAALESTKTFERSQPATEAFVQAAMGEHNIDIPAEAIVRVFGERAPEAFAGIPGFEEQLRQAITTGGDVTIPAEKALTLPQETWQAIRDDMRVRDGSLTKTEATELPEFTKALEEGQQKVLADLEQKHEDLQSELAQEMIRSPEGSDKTRELRTDITVNRKAFVRAGGQLPTPEGEPTPPPLDVPLLMDLRQAARRELWLKPLFHDAESAGMTKDEFARYSKRLEGEEIEAREAEIERQRRKITRERTQEWKDNEADVREEVTRDLTYRPDILADNYFRTGKIGPNEHPRVKLDADLIRETYGPDVLDGLPDRAVTKKGGVDPSEIAPLLGFKSGGALVNALRSLERERGEATPKEHLDRLIDEETERRMQERFGDVDETSLEAAREAVGTGGQADLLANEMFALAKKLGDTVPPFTREAVDRQIKQDLGKQNWRAVKPLALARDAGRAGRKAELALLKGDTAEAFRHKQEQYVALQKMRAAYAFAKERAKVQRIINKYQDNVIVKGTDQDYTDQIHALLDALGEDIPRTQENLAAVARGLNAFIEREARENLVRIEPYNPPLADATSNRPTKTLRELTVGEFRDFAKTLESLDYNGRSEKAYEVAGRKIAHDDAVERVTGNLADIKGRPKNLEGESVLRVAGRSLDAMWIKPEQLVDWIDKNNPLGIFNRLFYRPIKEAETWKLDKLRAMARDFRALKQPWSWRRKLGDMVDNDTLMGKDGQPKPLNRGNMLKIMLNWGNESNRQKLLAGYNWDEASVKAWLDAHATKQDWQLVQQIWDIFDKHLRGDVEARTRRMTGVAVDLIEPQAIDTPHGKFKGGYFPAIEDANSKVLRAKQESPDLFDSQPFHAMPTASSVKARTGAIYPVSLAWNDWAHTVVDTTHYLAFAEAARDALRLIRDERVRTSIGDAFGLEYLKQLDGWLKHVASDGGVRDNASLHFLGRVSQELRANVQTMMIGFNPVTGFLHGGSAAMNSVAEVGGRGIKSFLKTGAVDVPVATAKTVYAYTIGRLFRSPESMRTMITEVYEKSGELRNRKITLDDSIRAQMEKAFGDKGLKAMRSAFSQYSMGIVANLDLWSAIATWKATYDVQLMKGVSEADAIYVADKTVRNAHGASGLSDVAAIQRGPEFLRWFTMFMGYFVHNYNRQRNIGRVLQNKTELEGMGKWAMLSAATMANIIGPALWHAYLRGPEEEEDQTLGAWVADSLTNPLVIASQLGGSMPLVREMLYSLEHGKGASQPIQNFMDGFTRPIVDAMKFAKDGEVSDKWVQHALEFPGWTMGLSTKEIGRAGQYLWDYHQDNVAPEGFVDWYKGLTGKAERK